MGGGSVFEGPQPVVWFLLVLYGCIITSMLSASLGLAGSQDAGGAALGGARES